MRKKYISLALIIAFIGIFNFFEGVKGSVVPNLIYFNTDKESYYIDEEIKINASWELDYINGSEISFMYVSIRNMHYDLLWISPYYPEIGAFQRNWTVQILDLGLIFENESIQIKVQFCLYYNNYQMSTTLVLSEILVDITKRDMSCQLIGFPNVLKQGEILTLQARFYDTLLNNSDNLINQEIECKIMSDDTCLLNKSFILNSSGIVEVSFNTLNVSGNQNYLIFSIKGNEHYIDSEFEYEIIMETNQINNVPEDPTPLTFDILLFFSIPILLVISMAIVLIDKNKKSKHRKLVDITIRY